MPNPKTIEELLKMKPCPFEDGKLIPEGAFKIAEKNGLMDKDIYLIAWSLFRCEPFKMPDGYYHLPSDKQLGLPLGLWTRRGIYPLVKVLPFGVVKSYCFNDDFGIDHNADTLQPNDFDGRESKITILKQPPNLFNPLDQQAEEAPVEPERVSVQEFAENPVGKWFNFKNNGYVQFVAESYEQTAVSVREIIVEDNPIYATDPTAWLAWLAKQEGESE